MTKIIDEVIFDLNFIRSHTLQPKWYKVLKVFLLLGFLAGYWYLFGFTKSLLFLVVFVLLSLVIHFTYRIKTDKYRQSWLDFVVVEENGETKAKRIGGYYYLFIVINFILSIIISQQFR